MSLRPPERFASAGSAHDLLDYEIAAEKAAALGRAGRKAEVALSRLREGAGERQVLLGEAAEAVYAYFIQRELCGMRRHEAVIRFYDIPKTVLARLGAKT
jgi:hypothetical protein